MEAILKFEDYHVLNTQYILNPFFDEDDEQSLNPVFDLSIDFPDEGKNNLAFIKLGVSIGDEDLLNNSFFVSATILGIFTLNIPEENKDDEETIINQFYKINAVAILFPYLRSLISDLTSKGSETPVIIPTINVVELMKKEGSTE